MTILLLLKIINLLLHNDRFQLVIIVSKIKALVFEFLWVDCRLFSFNLGLMDFEYDDLLMWIKDNVHSMKWNGWIGK